MKVVVITNDTRSSPLYRKINFLTRRFAKALLAAPPGSPIKESYTHSSGRTIPFVKNTANPDPACRWHHAGFPGSKYGPEYKV